MSDQDTQPGPVDTLTILCWYLNHHEGETLSVDQIADETGLSWAQTQKYVMAIEKLNRIAPDISTETADIEVTEQAAVAAELFTDDAVAIAGYLFNRGLVDGDVAKPADITEHDVLADNRDVIDNMESLGWIDRDGDAIQLTPTGVQVIGPARSRATHGVTD